MKKIRLAIFDGGHVRDVTIPPFNKLPDIVVWGERFYKFHEMLPEPEDDCIAEYREAFTYFIVQEAGEHAS